GWALRVGDVRPREGGLHRRALAQAGAVRARPRGHALPRRAGHSAARCRCPDEVGPRRRDRQAKLLRALQEREVERLGATRTIPLDVRVIAATNVDLRQLVRARAFREDLYYRLNVATLAIPPLRDRKEDLDRTGT